MRNRTLIQTAIAVVIGAAVASAGSFGGEQVGGVPLFALIAGWAFLVNWVAFIPAYAARTEKFYDLTGSFTYVSSMLLGLVLVDVRDTRTLLLVALVLIWALRLGTFLFRRISRDGKDGRFDAIKQDWARFLLAWTTQGLWVVFTAAAALAAITSGNKESFGVIGVIGLAIWIFGFAFEVIADRQKSAFRADPANEGRFISTGLWSKSRHPNYFGEFTLWLGVAIIAIPALQGWQFIALLSPVFVYLLLNRFSGVPMLEKRADKKWGGEPTYETYKAETPVFFPKL